MKCFADLCCDDTAGPQKCFEGTSESEESVAPPAERVKAADWWRGEAGGEVGGGSRFTKCGQLFARWLVRYQACGPSRCQRTNNESREDCELCCCDALMWSLSDLTNHNSAINHSSSNVLPLPLPFPPILWVDASSLYIKLMIVSVEGVTFSLFSHLHLICCTITLGTVFLQI